MENQMVKEKNKNKQYYILNANTEKEEYTEFIKNHEKATFLQTFGWAKVKYDWKHEVVIVRDENGKIKGSVSVLIRKIPIFKNTLMYAPRGPIFDENDEETFNLLIDGIDELAKKYKAFLFKFDPDVEFSNDNFKRMLKNRKIKVLGKVKDATQLMQPRYVCRTNIKDKTEEDVFASFHSKTRYNIRLATKKGVTVREGTRKDLADFKNIMDVTGQRDGFFIRSLEYFEKIYDSLEPNSLKILFADYEGKPIATVMNILFGNKVWFLYGGSLNEYRNVMPAYLIQWEMIKWAIQNNCDVYDFRGISAIDLEHKNEGLWRFKKGFNAELIRLTEGYKVYNHFIYFLFEKFGTFYRDFRLKLNKLKKKVK